MTILRNVPTDRDVHIAIIVTDGSMQTGRPTLHQASDAPSERSQLPVISSLWIGQLTPLERLCLQSFVAQGHTFQLYTYDTIDNLPTGVVLADAGQILPASKVFQNQRGEGKGSLAAFSDLFRYKLMVERGGWWVDTDVFCLKAFDFAAPYVFGAEDKPVATGIIKMPQGCDLAERCYKSACRVNRKKIIWNELAVILEHGVREFDLMSYVLPAETFSPIMWNEVPDYVRGEKFYTPGPCSYGVHLYNEMWRRNNLDKWGTYPASSVLTVLRKIAGVENEKPIARPTVPFQLPAAPRQSRLAQLWPFRRAA